MKNDLPFDQCSPISTISYQQRGEEKFPYEYPNGEARKFDRGKELIEEPAAFEKAIEACGFGKFNYILMLICFPCSMSTSFSSTTLSFVIPMAHCDLELTLFKKGVLNAITYLGMICSAFMWGFLADTLGRRKMLMLGLSLSGIFNVFAVLSFDYWTLLFAKFFDGFCISGPYAILTSYVSELHSKEYRAKLVLFTGVCFSTTAVILPCLGWLILPLKIVWPIFNGWYVFHSWKVFLMICTVPSAAAALCIYFMPESPKFLMTMGRNRDALKIFQNIYALNTGKSPESYPIKELIDERSAPDAPTISLFGAKKSAQNSGTTQPVPKVGLGVKLMSGWNQIRPLFKPPHVSKAVLAFSIQLLGMLGINTLRLWLPQLYTIIELYQLSHNGQSAPLCQIMEDSPYLKSVPNDTSSVEFCDAISMEDKVFINYIIMGTIQGVMCIFASTIVNYMGKKLILITFYMGSGFLVGSLYFANNELVTLLVPSFYCGLVSISVTTLITVVIDVIPTNLRAMTISLTMMCGRAGALFGNLIFPLLLQSGCFPPFIFLALLTFMCGVLSIFLPKSDLIPLK